MNKQINDFKIGYRLEKASLVFNKTKQIIDLVEKNQNNNDLKELELAIEKNADHFKKLNRMEADIENMHDELLEEASQELSSWADNKTHFLSIFKKWKAKSVLQKMKETINTVIMNELDEQGKRELLNTVNRMENAITTIMTMQERIETYIEQQQLAIYMEALSKNEDNLEIPDEYKSIINELKENVLNNKVKERCSYKPLF